MPVCIAGMHRSGTSMLANMMHVCGLYLGPEDRLMAPSPSNVQGHWENTRFVNINDEILKCLGGTWYSPPIAHWDSSELNGAKTRAELLLREYAGCEPWGWKDPRNSLTLPFWLDLIPDLKIVICLRHPLEVSKSLRARPVFKHSPGNALWTAFKELRYDFSLTKRRFFSQRASLKLWQTYNERILQSTQSGHRIVTHYEAFFCNPINELRRVLDFTGIGVSEHILHRAADICSSDLHHNRLRSQKLGDEDMPSAISDLYSKLCEEAHFSHSPKPN